MSVPALLAGDGTPITYASLSISRSLEQLVGRLSFRTHEVLAARMVETVEARDGGRTVFRGFLETSKGTPRSGFACSAASLTSSFTVYDAIGNERFRDASALAILRTLANRAGVPLSSAPTTTVRRFRLAKGEDYAKAIQRLAESYRFLPTDSADGSLRAYTLAETVSATWQEGVYPVIGEVDVDLDFADWRDEYVVRGQREVVSGDLPVDGAGDLNLGVGTGARRASRRVLPNKSTANRADAVRYLDWQAKKALAAVVRFTVRLSGWPPVIDTGSRIRLRVPAMNVDDEVIVSALTHDVSTSALQTTASCVLPDVYSYRPLRRGNVERTVSRWALVRNRGARDQRLAP